MYDQVLKEFVAAYGPLAIMLEDLHHFDSISWQFLTTVVENLSEQVLVVTTMRPDDGVLAAASRQEEGEYSIKFVLYSNRHFLIKFEVMLISL